MSVLTVEPGMQHPIRCERQAVHRRADARRDDPDTGARLQSLGILGADIRPLCDEIRAPRVQIEVVEHSLLLAAEVEKQSSDVPVVQTAHVTGQRGSGIRVEMEDGRNLSSIGATSCPGVPPILRRARHFRVLPSPGHDEAAATGSRSAFRGSDYPAGGASTNRGLGAYLAVARRYSRTASTRR